MRVSVANIQRGSLSVIGSGLSEREVGSGLSEQEVHGANHCRKILRVLEDLGYKDFLRSD